MLTKAEAKKIEEAQAAELQDPDPIPAASAPAATETQVPPSDVQQAATASVQEAYGADQPMIEAADDSDHMQQPAPDNSGSEAVQATAASGKDRGASTSTHSGPNASPHASDASASAPAQDRAEAVTATADVAAVTATADVAAADDSTAKATANSAAASSAKLEQESYVTAGSPALSSQAVPDGSITARLINATRPEKASSDEVLAATSSPAGAGLLSKAAQAVTDTIRRITSPKQPPKKRRRSPPAAAAAAATPRHPRSMPATTVARFLATRIPSVPAKGASAASVESAGPQGTLSAAAPGSDAQDPVVTAALSQPASVRGSPSKGAVETHSQATVIKETDKVVHAASSETAEPVGLTTEAATAAANLAAAFPKARLILAASQPAPWASASSTMDAIRSKDGRQQKEKQNMQQPGSPLLAMLETAKESIVARSASGQCKCLVKTKYSVISGTQACATCCL